MRKSLFFFIFFMLSGSVHAEKDRLAVMDVTDEDGIFDEKTLNNVTDYIFTKFQGTGLFWMIPKSDRDTALDKAIEETKLSSRKECVDEKCQLSLVAELQANFLINTKIKKLYENTCQISISKFDVEKRAGVFSWEEKFNCTGKAVFEAIDGMNLSGKKSGIFKEGKIGETIEDWEVGTGEETIVKFESDPAEAVVLVDGRIVCQKTPCSKQLTTGKHEIVIQKENYLPKSKIFDIKKGLSVKEELEPDFGWLNITGKYTVELKLDGEIIGNIPIEKKIINPGAHEIEHTNSCYYQSGEKFTIKRGETKNITLDLKPKESAIKVNARDDKGNDIEADVFVDGNKVGTAPGTFKIPMCSKDLIVLKEKLQFKKTLSLEEKKVSEIDAVLKPTGLSWSKKGPNEMNWSNAKSYCANLKEDGYSDWRLPTISELRTLIKNCPETETGGECRVTDNCLSSENCRTDACMGCESDKFSKNLFKYSVLGTLEDLWSSSEMSNYTIVAWTVDFMHGSVGSKSKDHDSNVRCVRKIEKGGRE